MDRLSFATLEKQGYTGYLLKDAPEKIVQFGEGNFLRAFADNFVDLMNEKAGFNAKVVLVQPRGGHPEAADRFGEQDGLYTLILRGRENGEPVEHTRVISAASRCLDPKRDWAKLLDCARNPELRFVISNTTGRGTPFGAPAPTVKISTNSALYNKKGNWIDFNAGSVAEGESLDDAGDRLLDYVLRVASGEKTKAEQHGAKEIAIFKDGVTL